MDYEVESDLEWEDEPEGESLSVSSAVQALILPLSGNCRLPGPSQPSNTLLIRGHSMLCSHGRLRGDLRHTLSPRHRYHVLSLAFMVHPLITRLPCDQLVPVRKSSCTSIHPSHCQRTGFASTWNALRFRPCQE